MSDSELSEGLFSAIDSDDFDLIKILIEQGANLNAQLDDITPLIYASIENKPQMIKFFLSKSVQINSRDSKLGLTPLHFAIANGAFDSAKLLIESGADVNSLGFDNTTPLILASEQNSLEIVSLLLSKGADPTIKGPDNYTARMIAQSNNFESLITPLLCAEVSKKKLSSLVSDPDLCYEFICACEVGDLVRVSSMIDAGIDVNFFVNDNSALLVASSNGKTEIVKKLLDSNSNPNLCDSLGNSPLIYATINDFPQIVSLLLSKGANPNLKNKEGFSALSIALSNDLKSIQSLLLSKGAS